MSDTGGRNRKFLKRVLESGFDCGLLKPEDLLQHVTVDMLAVHLPIPVKARLLKAGLESASMTPQLIVDTVGFENLSEHMPANAVWACVILGATRSLGNEVPVSSVAPPKEARGNGASSLRRRPTRPPPPPRPGARTEPVPGSTVPVQESPATLERKPNVIAPAGSAPSVSRRMSRPGTLDQALDALEVDDSVFEEQTRTGESMARPDTLGPERADPTDAGQGGQRSGSDWNDEDTNPGGIRRGGF